MVQQGEVNLEGEQNRVKELKTQCARLEQESVVLRTEAQKLPVPQVLVKEYIYVYNIYIHMLKNIYIYVSHCL
jgi:hypothetical protein